MTQADGTGRNGVCLVGSSLDTAGLKTGKPFTGRGGLMLQRLLDRKGWKREDFLIDVACRCIPPNNYLKGLYYAKDVTRHCAPNLDLTLTTHKPKVLVALGDVAYERLTGRSGITKERGYVHWSDHAGAYVIGTYDPDEIVRGNANLSGVFLHDIERALQVAKEGWTPDRENFLLDPTPQEAGAWAHAYEIALWGNPEVMLAYDIETPYKSTGADEGELANEEMDASYTLLRIGFSYKEGEALSLPWLPEYYPVIRRLLGSHGPKAGWNLAYDFPRLDYHGFVVGGEQWDMMLAWHLLNSDLPKGLAFVATFYCPGRGLWKNLSSAEPARYNAIDAAVTIQIGEGLRRDLKTHRMWDLFRRHIVELDVELSRMSKAGVLVDNAVRLTLSQDFQSKLGEVAGRMQEVIPLSAKANKVYKKTPDMEEGIWTTIEEAGEWKECPGCGLKNPTKPHFKTFKKKENGPCAGLNPVIVSGMITRSARVLCFKPSKVGMMRYQAVAGHQPILDRKSKSERKDTFDEEALGKLIHKYPHDPLYPIVLDYRGWERKLGYTGVWDGESWRGGVPIGLDGRVHTTYGHNPSTFRLNSTNPNMQNQDPAVKGMYVAAAGHLLCEIDYSAIEALIVGWLAGSEQYMRLARLGVHDYFNSHVLARQGKIGQPGDLTWSDPDLKALFADLKLRFEHERDGSKRVVHLSNYCGTPFTMYEKHPELFASRKVAKELQDLYFEVCPDIQKWQTATIDQAEDAGYLRTPFGYLHRFWNVKSWKKEGGKWVSSWGEDAKRSVAFKPQNTALCIIAEAILHMRNTIVQPCLRLQVHDSLLSEVKESEMDTVLALKRRIMMRPVPELNGLVVGVEAKVGRSWEKAAMRKVG